MSREVNTCPKCGALVTPQLSRCRSCKHYLHGTAVEGFIFEHLLPPKLQAAPGTGLIFILTILFYALQAVVGGMHQALGFTSFTLVQIGSNWAPGIAQGEWWRFVTSMFAHGGIMHLGFNLYALTIVGPLIEQLFDRKKMLFVYLVSGVLSMVASYVVYVLWLQRGAHNSVGASGAVSGLIGCCWIGARRLGPAGRDVAQVMLRWSIFMAAFGLIMQGIDNAAHGGGWLIGAGMGALIPLGIVKKPSTNWLLSVGLVGFLALIGFSVFSMAMNLRGMPTSLENDASPRRVLFFTYAEGADPAYSSQTMLWQQCQDDVSAFRRGDKTFETAERACELASKAWGFHPGPFEYLRELYSERRAPGDEQRAQRLGVIVRRLIRR